MFHNLLISPGVSSVDGQNPGFTLFKVDLEDHKAYDLNFIFLGIEKTYGWRKIPPFKEWPFVKINFEKEFGLKDLSLPEIDKLYNSFEYN